MSKPSALPGSHRILAEEAAAGNAAQPLQPRPGLYVQRELFFQGQEEAGAFRFEYLLNDGQKQHNIWYDSLSTPDDVQLGLSCPMSVLCSIRIDISVKFITAGEWKSSFSMPYPCLRG